MKHALVGYLVVVCVNLPVARTRSFRCTHTGFILFLSLVVCSTCPPSPSLPLTLPPSLSPSLSSLPPSRALPLVLSLSLCACRKKDQVTQLSHAGHTAARTEIKREREQGHREHSAGNKSDKGSTGTVNSSRNKKQHAVTAEAEAHAREREREREKERMTRPAETAQSTG